MAVKNMVNSIKITKIPTSTSFSDLLGSISLEGSFFSTPRTTPSLVFTPMAVEPNFNQVLRHDRNDIFKSHSLGLHLRSSTYLDSFDGIFNLIDSTLRWESVNTTIVVLFAIGNECEIYCFNVWKFISNLPPLYLPAHPHFIIVIFCKFKLINEF